MNAYVIHNHKMNQLFLGFGEDACDAAEKVVAAHGGNLDDFGVGGSVPVSQGWMDLDALWPYFAMSPRCECDVIQRGKP